MRSLVMMTQADADNVRWSARREIRFAAGCFVVTLLTAAGLVVIGVAEGQALISWHYLSSLAWTAFGVGWALQALRAWSRLQEDLKEMQKEVRTTSNVQTRSQSRTIRGGAIRRYELIVDGETFLLPHHRLDELGFGTLRSGRSTTVEISRHGRELLAVRQHRGEGQAT